MPDPSRNVAILVGILLFFLGGILLGLFGTLAWAITWGLLLLYIAWLASGTAKPLRRACGDIARSRLFTGLLMGLVGVALVLGGAELFARAFSRVSGIEPPSPMQTQLPPGTEDWRLAHITADLHREPDPLLFWRPRKGGLYNDQRFKGPVAQIPKPPDVFRIMTYGDSNTEGPPNGAWPQYLQEHLNETSSEATRFEVLNAGVAGYSSYQGLARLREEIETYRPDVVVISFGWNDLANALGKPDHDFTAPSGLALTAQRLLLRFEFYRMIRSLLAAEENRPRGPRVPMERYVQNMQGFQELAAAHQADAVFLTRVTRSSEEKLRRRAPNWRAQVPRYNDALRRLDREGGLSVLDVQAWFEAQPGNSFVDESHLRDEGHRQMAGLVGDHLLRLSAETAP